MPASTKRLDRLDVGGQPLQRVAQPAPVERVRRQPLHVREHARAQVEQEALADPGGDVVVEERDHAGQQRQADVGEREREQRGELARHEHVVDDELEEVDLDRLDRRHERGEAEAEREAAPVGARVAARSAAAARGRRRRARRRRAAGRRRAWERGSGRAWGRSGGGPAPGAGPPRSWPDLSGGRRLRCRCCGDGGGRGAGDGGAARSSCCCSRTRSRRERPGTWR